MIFENTEVYGFYNAIVGMRNSYNSHNGIDSYHKVGGNDNVNVQGFVLGENDGKLARKLIKAGTDHGKLARQILISTRITAPEYWWKEFDTYKVGVTANSTSMMHKFGDQEITSDAYTFDNVDEDYHEYMNLMRRVQDKWLLSGGKKHSSSPEWRKLIQLNAGAFNYTRNVTMSYQNVRSICKQRQNHRLSEWWEFVDWGKTLPYADELIFVDRKRGEQQCRQADL